MMKVGLLQSLTYAQFTGTKCDASLHDTKHSQRRATLHCEASKLEKRDQVKNQVKGRAKCFVSLY